MVEALFEKVREAPIDVILGTAIAYRKDPHPSKVNLGIGAYRTAEGKPYLLPVVAKIQQELVAAETEKEYLGTDGLEGLKIGSQKLIFGSDAKVLSEKRVASVQSLSGTGGLSVVAGFITRFLLSPKPIIYVPLPTWQNHTGIFEYAGMEVREYRYWNEETHGVDIEGMVSDLQAAPSNSVLLLHACAHNPTGSDPSQEQWSRILEVVRKKQFLTLFDSAYQGYASGDLDKDAFAIRLFANHPDRLCFFVCQSFAKNMGLYCERVGMIHAVCPSEERARVVLTQLRVVVRRLYSNPPRWGAKIASEILNNEANLQSWKKELKGMADRVNSMRIKLRAKLEEIETPGNWDHITEQIGMFSYTGLNPKSCARMIGKWHIYMLTTGRISMAGITESNVDYVANAIKDSILHAE